MTVLGTKKFWRPSVGASSSQKENQILKNEGYINLQLQTVNYMSVGNFWQTTFGGKDKIALATTLKYQIGIDSIEATSVQDVREVKVNKNYNLGLQRNIAVKIPAGADAISIEVKMTAVKSDNLQAKFDMLNQNEYQAALELAPTVVGKVLTITSLAKKLFTDSDPYAQLEASYAGIISSQREDNPVSNGKLTQGLLIMVSTNDGDKFENVDESKFELKGDALYYGNKQVENTYLVFNISFEKFKGDDQKSLWFKKYSDALSNLDKIHLTEDKDEIAKIYIDSKNMWVEGNALIDADPTYIFKEKLQIKNAAIASIMEKYKELVASSSLYSLMNGGEILKNLTHAAPFNIFNSALPETSGFLKSNIEIDPKGSIDDSLLKDFKGEEHIGDLLTKDKIIYLASLQKQNLTFDLSAL